MMSPRLPRWALLVSTPPNDRAYLLAELEEEFGRVATESGLRAARAWYWREALSSVGPSLWSRRHRDGARGGAMGRTGRTLTHLLITLVPGRRAMATDASELLRDVDG